MESEKYKNEIHEALIAGAEAYRHDEKTEFLMLACCTALTWVAEELHKMNYGKVVEE